MTAIQTDQIDRARLGETVPLSFLPLDAEEESITLVAATVSVLDGAGEEVDAGDATVAEDGTLSYTVAFDKLELLDRYAVDWTERIDDTDGRTWRTLLEVCGGYLFSLAAFRGSRTEFISMSAAAVRRARTLAEARLENACAVAFVPRAARVWLKGDGRRTLILPHVEIREIYSGSVDGTALEGDELAELTPAPIGVLDRGPCGYWRRGAEIILHYAHGYDRPDERVVEAGLTLAREYAIPDSRVPPRAVLQATDYGFFRVGVAGRDGPTGIPDVDVVIADVSRRIPAVG